MIKKLNRIQIINIIAFLIVPFISSVISTIHIVSFFEIGNLSWMAYLLAISFELGSISSALAITVLDKISKFAVWSIFLILIVFQVIGNVYYSFQYITYIETTNPQYLDTINTFLTFFYEFETPSDFKVFLCILIGSPIPLISLAFLKSLVDYLNGIVLGQKPEIVDVIDNYTEDEIKQVVDNLEEEVEEEVEVQPEPEVVDEVESEPEETTAEPELTKDEQIEVLQRQLESKENELIKTFEKMKKYKISLFGDANADKN